MSNNKVKWQRNLFTQKLEPYMFEVRNNRAYKEWVHYKNSQCYNPNYKKYHADESNGLDAFRTALKLGYEVISN